MIDFLFTTMGGWIILAHLAGWIAFQPYVVRGLDRNTLVNCPEGNSNAHCKRYHEPTCRFKNGLSKNVDHGALIWGTTLAFIWEFVAVGVFLTKRANKPDAIQKEALAIIDEAQLDQLKEYERRKREMAESRELTAAAPHEDDQEGSSDEVVQAEIVSDAELRRIHREARIHKQKVQTEYSYRVPNWMSDKR